MNHLKLRLYPDAFLLRKSEPVKKVKENHVRTSVRMHELLKVLGGLGLSAPQVGVPYAVIVINTLGLIDGVKRTMFNPKIEVLTTEMHKFREGCLSFPGEFINSERPTEIAVQYTNTQGANVVETFRGISAACIQHEVDHLEGVLFKDIDKKV